MIHRISQTVTLLAVFSFICVYTLAVCTHTQAQVSFLLSNVSRTIKHFLGFF